MIPLVLRPSGGVLSSVTNWIRFSVPMGRGLPDDVWRRRHRGILVLLWIHAVGIACWAGIKDFSLDHIALDAGVVAVAATLAGILFKDEVREGSRLRRTLQASIASFGLVTSSAVLVHLSGGYIELHFHFFVMVGLMALYQDWVPFLLAIVYVVIHHGTVGVLNPASVYNHPGAWANPWLWAGIHGAFITAMSIVSLIGWRLNEGAHARFESILNSVGDGIIGVDLQGNTTFVNSATVQMGGWEAQELIGQPLHTTLHHSLRSDGTAAVLDVSDEVFSRKDGTHFPVEYVQTPIQEHGEVVGTVFVFKDITERKRAEKSLRLSEERFRTLTTLAPAGIFRTDAGGRCVYANERFLQLTGVAPEVMGDEGWTTVIHPEDCDRIMAAWEAAAQSGSEFSIECRVRTPEGQVSWVSGRAVALRNERGQIAGHMGTLTDISELKGAEAALRRSEAQLRQAQKMEAVGQLAGGVAHDFNNLLTVILGRGHLLQQRVKRGSSVSKDLDLIMTTSTKAAGLIKQLLAFSRKQVLQPKVLDLNGIVAGMGAMLRRLIGEHIDLVTALEPEVPHVSADLTQLEQIVVNLAVNARDAMPRGGRLTIATADVRLDSEVLERHPEVRPGPYSMLTVTDTGCGMDAEVQSHMFEPFFTTKEPGQGTGLGLATVYGIVKQHDGYVTVSSTPGQGTTFSIYLPRADGTARTTEVPVAKREVQRGSESILLVEDEEEVRRLASDVLRTKGYRVVEAASPKRALAYLERHRPDVDLLVTDVVMPEMSGPELAARLRSERPTLPVLYVSGYTRDMIRQHGVTGPDPTLLQKPFLPDDLARKVREVLDRTLVPAAP